MIEPVADLDLLAETPEEAAPNPAADMGHAERVGFDIWDGRRVIMKRMSVARMKQIQVAALNAHAESPMAANAAGMVEAVKFCLVSVGDQVAGVAGTSTEHLYKSLGAKGVEHAETVWRLMNRTTDEEDAAFLASIEVL